MKIINDSIDLLELQNLRIKELLSKEENKKIVSKLLDEKSNDNLYLKRTKKYLSIMNFIQFLVYFAGYIILADLSKESHLPYLSIVFCSLIIVNQITLQIKKVISFNYLCLISYFLYFNIYFYFMILIVYAINNPIQMEDHLDKLSLVIFIVIFMVLSNIYYFYLLIKREKITITIVQLFNLALTIYAIKSYNKFSIVLFLMFGISLSIFAFKYNDESSYLENSNIFVTKIINDMIDLINRLLNQNGIYQLVMKNEKIISTNLFEFKTFKNNKFNAFNNNNNVENKNSNFDLNRSSVYDNLNVNYSNNDCSNFYINKKVEENFNVFEFLSNFFQNENQRKPMNQEESEEDIGNMNKITFENKVTTPQQKTKKRFSFTRKSFSSHEISSFLNKNKNSNEEYKPPNTFSPHINVKNNFFNFSAIESNNGSNIQIIKKLPTNFYDSGNLNIDNIHGRNIIDNQDAFANKSSIRIYNTTGRKKQSKFYPMITRKTSNITVKTNIRKSKNKIDSSNNSFQVSEEINQNNDLNLENEPKKFQRNLLNVLKSLMNKISKRDSGNFTNLSVKKKIFSVGKANNNYNGNENKNNNIEIKKESKDKDNSIPYSNLNHTADNGATEKGRIKAFGNESKYTFLGNFVKKNLNSENLVEERTSYDIFYKSKSIKDNVFLELILKKRELIYTSNNINSYSNFKVKNTLSSFVKQKALNSNRISDDNLGKNQFAKLIHEFKTPINSILGLTGCLENDILENKRKDLLENISFIKGLSEYVIYLIRDLTQLCQFSRKDNQLFDYKIMKRDVSIKEILKFAYQILTTLLMTNDSKMGIKAYFNFDALIENLIVYSDEIRLKQILINFISNAVKFTQSGSITLEATVIKSEKKIKISITDSGIGIKDEHKQKLFKDFSMIPNRDDLNLFGSGLGLSINNYFVKQLDHKIYFNSEYGKGSCFYIVLDYNYIPRNMTYNDKIIDKRRFSTPINITQKNLEKSKNQQSPKNMIHNCNPHQDSSPRNQLSLSEVSSNDKKTRELEDDRMEFHYKNINSSTDSKMEQSIQDNIHNISSLSKYIISNFFYIIN